MLSYKRKAFVVIVLLCLCCVGAALLLCFRFSDMQVNTAIDNMIAPRMRTHISAKDSDTLTNLDILLKQNTTGYKGYIFAANVLSAEVSYGDKRLVAPVLLVNRTMLEEAPFFRLKKGKTFDFTSSSNSVILTGNRFQGVGLGKQMSITLYSEDGLSTKAIQTQVGGKADRLYALPEYTKNTAEDFLNYAQNLILLPDDGSYDSLFIQRQQTPVLLIRAMTENQYIQYSQLINEQQGISMLPASSVSYIRYYNPATLIVIVATAAMFFIMISFYIDFLLQKLGLLLRHELMSLIISFAVALPVFLITLFINISDTWRSVHAGYALIVFASTQLPLIIKNMISFVRFKQSKNKKVLHYEKI